MGKVLNEEIVRMHLGRQGEEDCSDGAIYIRDMDMIMKTDIIVAIYAHSWGAGYEIGYHIANSGKVICLISREQEETASAMCKGNPHINQLMYDSAQHAETLLKQALIEMRL